MGIFVPVIVEKHCLCLVNVDVQRRMGICQSETLNTLLLVKRMTTWSYEGDLIIL